MPLANMEEIYQAHARTVYKFLLSQCHDADLAEELTQETFYQAVRGNEPRPIFKNQIMYRSLPA